MHFYFPRFLHVYNSAENLYIGASCICTLGLVVYVHLSHDNFERSIPSSDPIKYVPLFDNISRHLLLRSNADFKVN